MLSDYVPGSASSALEDAINRNLLGSFLLVKTDILSFPKLLPEKNNIYLPVTLPMLLSPGKCSNWSGELVRGYSVFTTSYGIAHTVFICIYIIDQCWPLRFLPC